jgi:hypothetical protein
VLALTAAATDSAWNAGGSLLTFYFPIGLLVLVVALLYLQFARPHTIPGRKPLMPAPTSNPSPDQPRPAGPSDEPEAPKADA